MTISLKRFNHLINVNKDKFPMTSRQLIELIKSYGGNINSITLKQLVPNIDTYLKSEYCILERLHYTKDYDLKSKIDKLEAAWKPFENIEDTTIRVDHLKEALKTAIPHLCNSTKKPTTQETMHTIHGTREDNTAVKVIISNGNTEIINEIATKVHHLLKDIMAKRNGILQLIIQKPKTE